MKYLSLPHLAQYYDIHPDTLRRRLKEINIKKDEHYIKIGKSIRFDVEKMHSLITESELPDAFDSLLKRFLI